MIRTPFRLASSLAIVLALLVGVQAFAPARAYAGDSFNKDEIDQAMQDFYDHYNGKNTDDSQFLGNDRDRLTRVMARQLISLDANLFNDVIGHMIAIDYQQTPEDREAIEKLVEAMEEAGNGTVFNTEKGAKEKAGMTVLADTVAVWSVVCLSAGAARSWAAASEMTGFEKFAYVMKNTPQMMPRSVRSRLAIAGAGVAIGSAHAAYDYLYETRFDPRDALSRVQDEIIGSLAQKAADIRRSLESGSESASQLRQTASELESMETQVLQLAQDDPQYRGRLSTVSDDIAASKDLVQKDQN